MAQNGVQSVGVISPELESRMAELQAKTQEYGLGREQFVAILNEIGAKYLRRSLRSESAESFLRACDWKNWRWPGRAPQVMSVHGKSSWCVIAKSCMTLQRTL